MDTPTNCNRWFIDRALKSAIKQLRNEFRSEQLDADLKFENADPVDAEDRQINPAPAPDDIEIELQWGAAGEAGAKLIGETILDRITSCGVFVGDLTFVSEVETTDGRTKKMPNSNVLIETGAASQTGRRWDRMVLVLNNAYGTVEGLPFDLKHRHCTVQYHLGDNADPEKSEKRKRLATDFANQIRSMYRTAVIEYRADRERSAAEELAKARARAAEKIEAGRKRAEELWATFESDVQASQFHRFRPDGGQLTFALMPLEFTGTVDLNKIRNVAEELPSFRAANDFVRRADHLRAVRNSSQNETGTQSIEAVVALYRHAHIVAAQLLESEQFQGHAYRSVNYIGAELTIVTNTTKYIDLLRKLEVAGALQARFALHRVNGCQLIVSRKSLYSGPFDLSDQPDVIPPPIHIDGDVDGGDIQAIARALRPAFDWVWKQAGGRGCLSFDAHGKYDLS